VACEECRRACAAHVRAWRQDEANRRSTARYNVAAHRAKARLAVRFAGVYRRFLEEELERVGSVPLEFYRERDG